MSDRFYAEIQRHGRWSYYLEIKDRRWEAQSGEVFIVLGKRRALKKARRVIKRNMINASRRAEIETLTIHDIDERL